MIIRELHPLIAELVKTYPVITITGPRQSGKTTLSKMIFPDYSYCNLENPETRLLATQDPVGFFNLNKYPLIIDEVQRVPELLSYIQVMVDEKKENGMFILTGSQQFNLQASITQSLAGRTAMITLLPFSIKELGQFETIKKSRDSLIYNGFLPRIFDQNQQPTLAYKNYLETYIERDIRQLTNIKDLVNFEKFLRLLAGRVGQLINFTSLANDAGVSATTISNWLSMLEASYIIFRLHPYYENLGKRMIKSPKLYFIETGLLCYLLGIENENQVARDPLLGFLFENLVIADAIKTRLNKGLNPNLYFYRDSHHNEVDLLYKSGNLLIPIEIKASMTFHPELVSSIEKFQDKTKFSQKGYLVYGGGINFSYNESIQITNTEGIKYIFN